MPTKVYPTRCIIPPVQSEIFIKINEQNNLPETNCSFWNIIGVFTFCFVISFLSLWYKNLYLAITFSIITGIYLTSFCNCFFFSPRLFSKIVRYFFGILGGTIIATYIVYFTNDFINYLYLLITVPFCTFICLNLKYYKE
jgi:hypothetical protein